MVRNISISFNNIETNELWFPNEQELSDYLNPTLKWGPNEKETSVTKSLLNLNFDVNKHLSILEEDLKHEADLDFDWYFDITFCLGIKLSCCVLYRIFKSNYQ